MISPDNFCSPSTLDICWLRLDFETFNIDGPTNSQEDATTGVCKDTFTVTSSTSSIAYPVICGENAGQHSTYNVLYIKCLYTI